MSAAGGWEFWIDRGGTFTDIVARRPDGSATVHKLLSEDPARYSDAAVAGIRFLLGLPEGPIPAGTIAAVKMGTTIATNALLEHKGEATLLAITAGLGDALRIGYQNRPKLFARHIVLPEPLYGAVVEIDERIAADGDILRRLEEASARARLEAAHADGFRAVAIVLMHGYRHTAHEARVAEIAREIGFTQISTSHEVGPLIKLVGRGDTTVVDAYLSPVLGRYVERVSRALGEDARLLFMQSNGGLVDAHHFRGKDAILSGPAGGIVGMARTAAEAGFDAVIGFDMGGTSTDVSHFAGAYERTDETVVAGARLRAPMMLIHTVAAGGGSICSFDGARFRVGPESAGSNPGPACYRRGGPLTITDCNLLLGKIQPDFFPHVFGPSGRDSLDGEIVRRRFAELAEEVRRSGGRALSAVEIAEGFIAIAVTNMANAIKQISIQRGHDVTRHALACFGGAGGQHACLVADALGIGRIMIHPMAGVLSAYGIGLADLRTIRETTIQVPLTEDALSAVSDKARGLEELVRADLASQRIPLRSITVEQRAQVKYAGTDTALEVPLGGAAEMRTAFEALHRKRFGFAAPDRTLLMESLSVEAVGASYGGRIDSLRAVSESAAATPPLVSTRLAGRDWPTPVHDRGGLAPGAIVDGPAIVTDPASTTIVEPGWRCTVDRLGNLILDRVRAAKQRAAVGTDADPIMLEIFNSLFMAIAEQMGMALQNTAYSVNIKERLDFSCALFDRTGTLIANAPHMPVHLGSMGDSIRAIIAARGDGRDGRGMWPGDVYMLNAPYNGGTHRPVPRRPA